MLINLVNGILPGSIKDNIITVRQKRLLNGDEGCDETKGNDKRV